MLRYANGLIWNTKTLTCLFFNLLLTHEFYTTLRVLPRRFRCWSHFFIFFSQRQKNFLFLQSAGQSDQKYQSERPSVVRRSISQNANLEHYRSQIAELVRSGQINFSKSNTELDSCKQYLIENKEESSLKSVLVENCAEVATVLDININLD